MVAEFDNLDDLENLKTDRVFLKPVAATAGLKAKATGAAHVYRELTISEFTPHQNGLIIYFDEVADMDSAELVRSMEVYVYEEEMWDLPEGKYYGYQLAGLELYDLETNQTAGTVKELRSGVQDYLVVQSGQGEYLVPYVPEIIANVDLNSKRINAKLPPGIHEI